MRPYQIQSPAAIDTSAYDAAAVRAAQLAEAEYDAVAAVMADPVVLAPVAAAEGVDAESFSHEDLRALWVAGVEGGDPKAALQRTGHWHPDGPIGGEGSRWSDERLAFLAKQFPISVTATRANARRLMEAVREWGAAETGNGHVVAADPAPEGPRPVLVNLADVEPREVEWLCPEVFAKGKLNLLSGDPDVGKTTFALYATAVVTTGSPWMADRTRRTRPGSVILLSAEDGLADTIRPRLDAAGADVSRVVVLEGSSRVAADGKTVTREFTIDDIPTLDAAIRQTPQVEMVVIDPVSAYLSDTDSHKNAEIRGLLKPLAKLAERRNVAGWLGRF